jgi:hypothetical protein
MSYLSDKTGRPKEEGGHKRINVSLNLCTRDVLDSDSVENKSNLIEYCVDEFINPKWVAHHEPNVTINYDPSMFVEGAAFGFIPSFNPVNAVLNMMCCFNFDCEEGGVAFRVTVNGEQGLNLVENPSKKNGYTCSCGYDGKQLGFEDPWKRFYNQDRYVFTFEFKPLKQAVMVCVKDVYLFVQLVENPLLKEEELFTFLRDIL